MRDQILEARVHLSLGENVGHPGTCWPIETEDYHEEVFEVEPHVGDGELRRGMGYVTVIHRRRQDILVDVECRSHRQKVYLIPDKQPLLVHEQSVLVHQQSLLVREQSLL